MKTVRLVIPIMLLAVIVMLVPGCGAPGPAQVQKLTIFTGGTAGTYYPLGGGLAKIINEKTKVAEASVVSSGASAANARKIAEKEAGLALIQNDVAAQAYNGEEAFKDGAIKNIRGVATWYPETIQFVTLKEFNIRTLADLKGKKVGIGAPGSGTVIEALAILGGAGINRQNAELRDLDFKEVALGLQDKTLQAGVVVAGIPTAAVTDVATTRDVYIVEVPDEAYNAIKGKFPYFVQQTIPANTYKGMDKSVKTVAVMAILVTREDVPTDVIYQITKAMFENLDTLVATHARAKDISLKGAVEGMPIPLHPGAEKYYKEKGILK
jgi:TRAP transporter TAXI family solute receptor